jgi:hypothetical protein
MKKFILSVSMVLFAFMTQAAETKNLKNQFSSQPNNIQSFLMAPCTVTAKGTVDLGPVAVEVSCSVTASTCPEASVQAATCLKASLATVSSVIL